ncbi:integrator complex subunit 7-like [Oppia nitens]|uniref:integrator complex subunit 7-like n=1 Tax=Oppia nitens TaxID=1686743 RepID=UPI0023DA3F18|nr:integrator complex subunit 7-like [Oppia nitens]
MNVPTGDPEANLDANQMLTELDKGLRSAVLGDQCESIVRFPFLMERYPFPILINSASLKLSDVYRTGSNFLRVLILHVMRESEKHLDKIVNIDEFVRRLFSVTYSNDPLARTITLKTLATMARIVCNRKSIHHYIRNSLDSNDQLEVLAAIEAAAAFADKSTEFAANIYPKIFSMINGLTTPLETKAKLLLVLYNIHFDCEVADKVRQNCLQMLETYPSEEFVCSDLHVLTHIASVSLTQIPDQIQVLLDYFINDPRNNVKLSVLSDLKSLATSRPHLWQKESTSALVDAIVNLKNRKTSKRDTKLLCRSLSVLSQLTASPTLFSDEPQYYSEMSVKIINICITSVYCEQSIELISTCISILTNISLNLNTNFLVNIDVMQETCCCIQSFLLSHMTTDDNYSEIDRLSLKSVFQCIHSLCRSQKLSSITQITESLRFVIMTVKIDSLWFAMASEVICAINSTVSTNETFATGDDILELIKLSAKQSIEDSKRSPNENSNFSNLLSIYFQLNLQKGTNIDELMANELLGLMKGRDLWSCFKIVRQAMRYGQHLMASMILDKLVTYMEPIESIHFWIKSLVNISKAESFLIKDSASDLNKSLRTSIALYIEGLTHLKASISVNNPMRFECEFVKLRLKYLQTHQYFQQCCRLIQTSPPPAIAASTALTTRDDLLKCGNIVVAMRKSAKEFRSMAESYSLLYQSSFNADDNTLSQLQLIQNSCVILAEAIENLFQSNRLNAMVVSKDNPFETKTELSSTHCLPLEHKSMIEVCSTVSTLIHKNFVVSSLQTPNETIGSKQIQLLQQISVQMVRAPLSFPRFYFQSVQNTCIKLAVSPQPKSGDYLTLHTNSHFALRIEGVVINTKTQKQIRKVGKVLISVNAVLITRAANANNNSEQQLLMKSTDTNVAQQSVVYPLNDYFQVQFLLLLPIAGLYSVNIETSIIDENESQWKTGPNMSLSAKVMDDQSSK